MAESLKMALGEINVPTIDADGASQSYPRRGYAWSVVALLLVAYSIALVDRQILSLLVQPVRADLGISDTQLSLLVGFAFVLFYSTLGLVAGGLADRFSRRNMIVVGMILWSLATIGCGLANTFWELFFARMLVGVGEATLSPAAYSMIADLFRPERRSRAAAVYTTGAFMGGGAAFVFGGAAISAMAKTDWVTMPIVGAVRSWQAAFMLVGAPGIIVALITLLWVREPVRQEIRRATTSLSDLFGFIGRNRSLLGFILLGFGLNGLMNIGLMTWVPARFIRSYGWTAGDIGLAFGLVQMVIGTAGVVAGGWWVSRPPIVAQGHRGVLKTSRNALLAMPVLALVVGLSPSAPITIVALAAIMFPIGVAAALAPVAVYAVTPNEFRAQTISFYLLAGTLIPYGFGITLIAAVTDYGFENDAAVGKSLALVLFGASLLGAACHHAAMRHDPR